MEGSSAPSREVALVPSETAVLVIDMQNACCHPKGCLQKDPSEHYLQALPSVLGNIKALLLASRAQQIECMFTVIESLTKNGRDRSLDYKVSALHVPKGSWDAKVLDCIAPLDDEMVFPKCSSSVFMSTNIAYKLRNLGVKQVVIVGGLTDQCVDSATRDACDAGFLVTLVTDAVITHSKERHDSALCNNTGYARQRTTLELLKELALPGASAQPPPPVLSPFADPSTSPGPFPFDGSKTDTPSPRAYVRFEIVDLNGAVLQKLVPVRQRLDKLDLFSGTIGFGSSHEVIVIPPEVMEKGCPNAELVPDWTTEQVLPWAAVTCARDGPASSVVISRVYCEQRSIHDKKALNPAVPRTAAKRMLDKLEAEFGLRLLAAHELEFVLATGNDWSTPVFQGQQFCRAFQASKVGGFMCAVEEAMSAVNIHMAAMHTECGAGQLEMSFEPKWGVEAGDASITFKAAVKELAQQRGMLATFQSKPFTRAGPGNGGHFNFSLWKKSESTTQESLGRKPSWMLDGWCSALHDPSSPDGLSPTAHHFLAGILAHARALEAFAAPTPPCYCRHGSWAPVYANYRNEDRFAAVRVKTASSASSDGRDCYLEFRSASASGCAYLLIASIIAAGLDGLRKKLPLPPPGQGEAENATKLPTSVGESLDALEADTELVSELGEDLVKWFVGTKRAEVSAVDAAIAEAVGKGDGSPEEVEKATLAVWRRFYMEFL